jgi:Flp pilus assembly protein TadD
MDEMAVPYVSPNGTIAAARPNPPAPEPAIETAAAPVPSFEPTTAADRTRTGNGAFSTRDFESAKSAYQRALDEKPNDPETLNSLGQVLVRLGQAADAVPRFERAVALAPDKWAYHFNLAHALGQLAQWDRAVAEYRQAARIFPEDYATQYNLAMALHKKGDERAAVPEFQKAIDLAPGEPSFHMSLGISLENLGRTAEAIHEYRVFLEMSPSAAEAGKLKAHIDALVSARPGAGAKTSSAS